MPLNPYFESSVNMDGVIIKGGRTLDTGQQIRVDEVIPANSTNAVVALAFNTAKLVAYQYLANADCTLKFNSNTGDPAVTLHANQPEQWHDQMAGAKVHTNSVTDVRVTTGNAETRIRLLAYVDPT